MRTSSTLLNWYNPHPVSLAWTIAISGSGSFHDPLLGWKNIDCVGRVNKHGLSHRVSKLVYNCGFPGLWDQCTSSRIFFQAGMLPSEAVPWCLMYDSTLLVSAVNARNILWHEFVMSVGISVLRIYQVYGDGQAWKSWRACDFILPKASFHPSRVSKSEVTSHQPPWSHPFDGYARH